MNLDVAVLLGVIAALIGLVAIDAGALEFALLAFALSGWGWWTVAERVRSSDLDRVGEPERADEVERAGQCAACGRMVAVGKDRCDDCSIVGSWRK